MALYLRNISPYGIHVGALHTPTSVEDGLYRSQHYPLGIIALRPPPKLAEWNCCGVMEIIVVLKDDTYNVHSPLVDSIWQTLQSRSVATMSGP